MRLSRSLLLCAALLFSTVLAQAQLRGHGGPVRAVAVSADGQIAISGSFDTSAIRWSLARNSAEQVLRFHESAVNAVAIVDAQRQATGGEDGKIAIWRNGNPLPERTFEGHTAPIVSLAVSPDGKWIASASWDRTVRLWPLAGGEPRVLDGHNQNVNGVAFTRDGKFLVSASYDLTLRIWPLGGGDPQVVTLASPLNAVAVTADAEVIAAGADGNIFLVGLDGKQLGEIDVTNGPIISLAVSPDGSLLAAAGIRGSVTVIDRKARKILRTLVGPGLPVWSVAFFGDNKTLLTGGADSLIRRWDALTGDQLGAVAANGPDNPLAAYAGDRGAEIFKACIACHTLTPDEGNRAGPTLHGIFGRRIATLPGYDFSPALKRMDIVWTKETVAALFEKGPMEYTPGTKMPEQRVTSPEDRRALVDFLEKATR
ncbi:MAG: c-type cytochrome [Pseudorhodoplanes sp.]